MCDRILIYNCRDSHHIDGNVLMVAAYCGRTEIIKELADSFPEIDVNMRGEGGKSALHYAVLGKAPQAIKELVTLFPDIDVNMRDDKEFTPLHTAIGTTPAVIRELTNIASCDVNAKNKVGDTALIIAAKYGYIEEIIELAKIPNINPKLENNNGDTAIDTAQTELTRRCLIKLFPYFKK